MAGDQGVTEKCSDESPVTATRGWQPVSLAQRSSFLITVRSVKHVSSLISPLLSFIDWFHTLKTHGPNKYLCSAVTPAPDRQNSASSLELHGYFFPFLQGVVKESISNQPLDFPFLTTLLLNWIKPVKDISVTTLERIVQDSSHQ